MIPMEIEQIAELCHEVNRAFCQSSGDHSQPPWADVPEWHRASTFSGIANARDQEPGDAHRHWMADKIKDGWKYGPVKNPENKTHPSMVPFEELSPSEQQKDALFLAVVQTCLGFTEQPDPRPPG